MEGKRKERGKERKSFFMPRRPVCHPSLDTFPVLFLSLSLSVFDSPFFSFPFFFDSYLNTFMFEGFTIQYNSSEEWSFFFLSLFLPEWPKMYWEMDVVCDEMCSSSRLRMNGHSTFGYWSLYHKGQIKNIWNGNWQKGKGWEADEVGRSHCLRVTSSQILYSYV